MKRRFKEWCAKERVGRIEEGTSQDMCSTNGDALFMILWFGGWYTFIVVMLFIGIIYGV
jgi:hypothetical protein